MSKTDIFIMAGEASGDLHGASLIREIRKSQRDKPLRIEGVGGKNMVPLLDHVLFRTEELSIMGFIYVIKAFWKIWKKFSLLRKTLLAKDPEVVVFIDYAEFNLLMEKSLRKRGYKGKIIHYVSPSVWAWRKGRIKTLEQNVDHLLSIFPFEKKHYQHTSLPVTYIGNPLTHPAPFLSPKRDNIAKTIGLFPGSRKKEIEKNLSYLLSVAKKILIEDPTVQFILSIASKKVQAPIKEKLAKLPKETRSKFSIKDSKSSKDFFTELDYAIATSGTINLELALHKIPTIVVFAVGKMDLVIIRDILRIRLPYYCIVNIIAEQMIFPELYGPNLTEQALYEVSMRLLRNEENILDEMRNQCEVVKKTLGDKNASHEAAGIVCGYLGR